MKTNNARHFIQEVILLKVSHCSKKARHKSFGILKNKSEYCILNTTNLASVQKVKKLIPKRIT